jgi:hypothetical protein
MAKDNRDLLTVLKAELEFLEKGGYLHSPSASWRPQFIFEDSLTCMNHDRRVSQLPCSECILMNLVPADCRNVKIPCRHIPLNAEGFTIDTYYRLGTQEEVEAAVAAWLRKTISQLEVDRRSERSEITVATGPRSEANVAD